MADARRNWPQLVREAQAEFLDGLERLTRAVESGEAAAREREIQAMVRYQNQLFAHLYFLVELLREVGTDADPAFWDPLN